jgi:serine/threonine-protein kinase
VPELAVPLPAFQPESLVGTTIDGRYLLTAHLATGGMGAVFRAEHIYMRKDVAVKVLRPDLTATSDIVERFRREAQIAASLEHDNIVRVTDFGRSPEGYLFLVMELLEGESLFDRLRRVGTMSARESLPILVQICSGLEAAHQRGVIHRDLKPENIFLHQLPGTPPVAKILDFGIAKITDPQSRSETQAGMVVGTPEYLSPEQALGGSVDPRADIYAVGIIAWRMLAGYHPFRTDDARALLLMHATQPLPPLTDPRPDLAGCPALVAAVARASAKSAAERHRSAAELRQELEACIGQGSLAGEKVPVTPLPEGLVIAATAPVTRVGSAPWLVRAFGRVASAAGRLRSALRQAPERARRAWARPWLRRSAAAAVAALALFAVGLALRHWMEGRSAARAEQLLAAGKPEAARSLLEEAVAQRPREPRLQALLGRALHRIPGQSAASLQAFEAAADRDPASLDVQALADLAGDLGGDRGTADRAARVLEKAGPAAAPVILAAAGSGTGASRLRALELARGLGIEERIDRVSAWSALLADPDCEVRRAAVRRLGEIGSAAALPALQALSASRQEARGFLGAAQSLPACGAGEAAAAARQLEATAGRPH